MAVLMYFFLDGNLCHNLADPHGAIARRFIPIHITAPTYGGTPAPVR